MECMVTISEVQPGAWRGYWLLVTMPGAQSDGAWRDGGQGAASSYSQYGAGVSSVAGTVLNLFLFIEHRAVLLYCAKYFICKMYT